jgi:DNA-binding NarL/FixJ family response regulator
VTGRNDPPKPIDRRSVVLIATSESGRAGVERIRQLSAQVSADLAGTRSMAICGRATAHNVQALLRTGFRGVVLREHMSHTLLPAVAAVASGQVCLPSGEVTAPLRAVLSVREKQVVGLVATGLMNAEIAERLFLAESTVKSHLTSAFAKLGVRSRHEAVEVLLNPAAGPGLGLLSLDAVLTRAEPAGPTRHPPLIPGSPGRPAPARDATRPEGRSSGPPLPALR